MHRPVLINPTMQDAFRCFARNGRWGCCVDCPTSSDGHRIPEVCVNTDRGDHQLDVDGLASMHKLALQDITRNR